MDIRSFHNVMSLILFSLASTYAVLQVLGGKPDPNTWNAIAWVILLFTAFNSASRVLPEDITSVRYYMTWNRTENAGLNIKVGISMLVP